MISLQPLPWFLPGDYIFLVLFCLLFNLVVGDVTPDTEVSIRFQERSVFCLISHWLLSLNSRNYPSFWRVYDYPADCLTTLWLDLRLDMSETEYSLFGPSFSSYCKRFCVLIYFLALFIFQSIIILRYSSFLLFYSGVKYCVSNIWVGNVASCFKFSCFSSKLTYSYKVW